MLAFVVPSVCRVVAETLGVSREDLTPGVSLTDDLAADSLDLLELALGLEAELGITLPEQTFDEVRTFGDLVHAAVALTRQQRQIEAMAEEEPRPVWARLVRPGGTLERAEWLTPYVAETIAEDALRAGHGARLEVFVAANANDASLAQVRDEFRWLVERGVEVRVASIRDYVSDRIGTRAWGVGESRARRAAAGGAGAANLG
jgi:acyl carrier protein